ncbi:MAG: DUF1289 domain-containing protein [Hyphomicrobiaceae bacterium]|nr:MAG: DUF1289 domain-containing protein [Hyphomicrobiaceae bacterium]
MPETPKIKSPCVGKCKLKDSICSGCGRTLDQIKNWTRLSDEARAQIMEKLALPA